MIPDGYFPAAAVTCVHVQCAGDVCRYAPPAIGPQLPRRVTSSDGVVWQRHGSLFYGPGNGADGRIALWTDLARSGDTEPPVRGLATFPRGAWTVLA